MKNLLLVLILFTLSFHAQSTVLGFSCGDTGEFYLQDLPQAVLDQVTSGDERKYDYRFAGNACEIESNIASNREYFVLVLREEQKILDVVSFGPFDLRMMNLKIDQTDFEDLYLKLEEGVVLEGDNDLRFGSDVGISGTAEFERGSGDFKIIIMPRGNH